MNRWRPGHDEPSWGSAIVALVIVVAILYAVLCGGVVLCHRAEGAYEQPVITDPAPCLPCHVECDHG